jgi:hypothetical protein
LTPRKTGGDPPAEDLDFGAVALLQRKDLDRVRMDCRGSREKRLLTAPLDRAGDFVGLLG